MTFKLKSGNKTSFKNMGSSPIKQSADGLGDPAAEIQKRTSEYEKAKAAARIAREEKAAQIQAKRDMMANAPWTDKAKQRNIEQYDTGQVDKYGNPIYEDPSEGTGLDVEDDDISKYKSKTQIKHDAKMRELESMSDDVYTDEERYTDKQAGLADRIDRAKGTGKSGLSFDWKRMLLGGDIASGFKIEPKKDILQRRKDKSTKKYNKKQAKISSQERIQNRKAEIQKEKNK